MVSNQKTSPQPTYGVEDFPVKTYRLLTKESAKDLKEQEVVSSTDLRTLRSKLSLVGYLWRMFRGYLIPKTEKISKVSSTRWMNSGMVYRGECWTQNTSEHPKDVEESILSQVVETSAPLRYFLNKTQLESLINRAESRNIPMPQELKEKIELQITTLSNMPELEEFLQLGRKQKDIEMTEKHILATLEEAPMLFVRRMLPSEYEKLQGFPQNWTQVDGEH